MGGGALLGNQTQDLTAFCCNPPPHSLKVSHNSSNPFGFPTFLDAVKAWGPAILKPGPCPLPAAVGLASPEPRGFPLPPLPSHHHTYYRLLATPPPPQLEQCLKFTLAVLHREAR